MAKPAVIASYSGPGDVVSGASMWWGLRGYNAAFTGNVANICDVATGLVCADVTWNGSALVFPLIGGVACNNITNICEVAKLYDQIAGNNCTAAPCDVLIAHGNRPTLIVSEAANGCTTTAFPCISFVRGSSQCLAAANNFTQAQPFSGAYVANRTGSTSNSQVLIGFSTLRYFGWQVSANTIRNLWSTAAASPTAANDNVWHSFQMTASASVGSTSVDGSSTASNTGAGTPSTQPIIGAATTTCSSTQFDGVFVEGGIWPSAFTAQNITDLNSNAHTYWGF